VKAKGHELKALNWKWAWMIMLMFSSNLYAQGKMVIDSREAASSDLSRLKSYSWASQVSNPLDVGNYFLNDIVLKADIKDAIGEELDERGYSLDDTRSDMMINVRVFDEPVTLNSYESYGAAYWGDVEFHAPADSLDTELQAGTLIISIVDKSAGKIVWEGFASGLIENNRFIKDEGKVREVVKLIFEQYNYRAGEYTKR
jgi:hypothetical protein